MKQRLASVTLVVKDYDEALRFFLGKLSFELVEDTKLTDQEEEQIIAVIEKHCEQFKDYHKLKTRKSGNMKHIDFHITLDPDLTVKEAHDIVGCLKKEMNERFLNTRVNIHIDPYRKQDG